MAYIKYFILLLFLFENYGALAGEITKFPSQIDKNCRGGTAKLYDECSNQVDIFNAALKSANENGKVLLVSYGAEWCIWCHVFDAYIEGGKTKFRYVYAYPDAPDEKYKSTIYEREKQDVTKEAQSLHEFFKDNFVIAHIENYHSSDGNSVLEISDATQNFNGGLPYIFTVDKQGKYAGHFASKRAETRRDTNDWYRGYNRRQLTQELYRLKELAQ